MNLGEALYEKGREKGRQIAQEEKDAVCGTVPDYRLRKRRWGKRLFRVNSAKEHTLVCVYSIGLLGLCMVLRRGLF